MTPDGLSQPSPHRALATAEIAGIIEQYRGAAINAKRAGFDGVEVMGANGHLIDQFLQDNSNKRIDYYGGSIENRTRLLVKVVEALADVWGANRVGVRIAPSGTFNGMADSNPRTLFRYVAERLNEFGLAYEDCITDHKTKPCCWRAAWRLHRRRDGPRAALVLRFG
jgi:N-ethylmaleimide reductase